MSRKGAMCTPTTNNTEERDFFFRGARSLAPTNMHPDSCRHPQVEALPSFFRQSSRVGSPSHQNWRRRPSTSLKKGHERDKREGSDTTQCKVWQGEEKILHSVHHNKQLSLAGCLFFEWFNSTSGSLSPLSLSSQPIPSTGPCPCLASSL